MTLALATRGYLCTGQGQGGVCPPFGPGPEIIGIAELAPGIDGAASIRAPGPTITGAGVPGPSIRTSTTPTETPADSAPKITGAADQKPDIDSSGSS